MKKLIKRLFKTNEEGATLIEYALLATLVAVAAIAAMQTLGHDISNQFVAIGNTVQR